MRIISSFSRSEAVKTKMEVPSYTNVDDPSLHQTVTQNERSHMIHHFFDYRTAGAGTGAVETMENETVGDVLDSLSTVLAQDTQGALQQKEQEINSRDQVIAIVQDETSSLYKGIYLILVGLFVAVLLAVITALRGQGLIENRLYYTLFVVILGSFVIYMIYIFNLFYVQETVKEIYNYIRYGRIDIGKIDLDMKFNLTRGGDSYAKRQCMMKKAEEDKYKKMSASSEKPEDVLLGDSTSSYRSRMEGKDTEDGEEKVFYRDNHSVLQRINRPETSNQSIYYPDRDGKSNYQETTSNL